MKTELTKVEPRTLATELALIQGQMGLLKEREDEIKEALLATLQHQGVQSIKLENGTMYVRNQRTSLKVKNEAKAWAWAMENPTARMKVDTAAALAVFRKELKLPTFFTKTTSEYLSIKQPKDHD